MLPKDESMERVMFGFLSEKKTPIEIERDKKLIESLNSMKTLITSNGSVSVHPSEFKKELKALHESLKHIPQR